MNRAQTTRFESPNCFTIVFDVSIYTLLSIGECFSSKVYLEVNLLAADYLICFQIDNFNRDSVTRHRTRSKGICIAI